MPRLPATIASLALAVLACACASEPAPPPGHARGGRPPDDRSRCAPLFASPAGEPFRARFGDTACPLESWFAGADLDHDGALTADEFRHDALRFFTTLDVDGDGVISSQEVRRYEEAVFPEILSGPRGVAHADGLLQRVALLQGGGGLGGGGGGGGGRSGGRGGHGSRGDHGGAGGGGGNPGSSEGAARWGLLDEAEPVSGSDMNLDGHITRAEFAKSADERFHLLDRDGKGRLSLSNLQARAAARGGGRGGRRGPPRQRS